MTATHDPQSSASRVERLTITIPEVAEILGIGRRQAYEAALRGEIPSLRIGRRILVPLAALRQMLGGAS